MAGKEAAAKRQSDADARNREELEARVAARDADMTEEVVAERKGSGKKKRAELTINFADGVAVVETDSSKVELDREGCLNAAKAFSRAAQAVA